MVSKVYSAGIEGIKARLIEVEVAAVSGLRTFNIVGLADTAIKEAKERVAAALRSTGFKPPHQERKRVLVSLAPADLKKQGSLYDLPIALGFLMASQQISFNPENKLILGELSLDGRLKPIKGAFLFSLLAREMGFSQIVLPQENASEAAIANLLDETQKCEIISANSLSRVVKFLQKQTSIAPTVINKEELSANLAAAEIDFSWIKGQSHAKRALVLAAGGGHHLLFYGPPGTGKTLLAKSIISILPKLSSQEAVELTKIYSASGLLNSQNPLMLKRPFRSPHHSASEPALIGGGAPIRPGEITLSHRGVLFLDELPEFHRDVLESLRQPLEEGVINIQRAKEQLTLPAKFMLIAAANPCPCGYYLDPEKACKCTGSQIASYRRKLSGPLMDRFDLFSSVPGLRYEELISPGQSQETEERKQAVKMAREIQKERFKNEDILTNSEMNILQIKKYCLIDSPSQELLRNAVNAGKLSARGYHRVLKLARTSADLKQSKNIAFSDVSEALSYRTEAISY